MNCEIKWEKISAFADGQLGKKEAQELELHIKDCAFCKERLEVIKSQKKILNSLTPQEEPATFDRGFQEKLSQAIERRKVFQAQFAFAGVAAAILLAALFTFAAVNPAFLKGELPMVLAARGTVETVLPQDTAPVSLDAGDRIQKGQVITTGQDGEVDLILKDKYVLKIKPNTSISIAAITRKNEKGLTALYVNKGKIAARTDEKFNGSEFLVNTRTASAHIRGTVFMVDVDPVRSYSTAVSVLTGKVEVNSIYTPAQMEQATQVFVRAGEKTDVRPNSVPSAPQRLPVEEWQSLQEIYGLGRKLQVALIIGTGPERVYELLKPCPLYISDEELKIAPKLLKETVSIINQAIESNDRTKHLKAIENLENIVSVYKDKSYSGQLLLFIGSYYRYIDEYEKAAAVFESVAREYKDKKNIASLAQCAAAIIYEKDLKQLQKAREAYNKVLENYPKSPESVEAQKALERMKSF